MYSELTRRVLVGGYASPTVYPPILAANGVTHIVNASNQPLPEIVANQFRLLEMLYANMNGSEDRAYWEKLFLFVKRALNRSHSRLYIHVQCSKLFESPVAVYAVLRMLGCSAPESHRKLERLHPVVTWYESAIQHVDMEFKRWATANHFREKCDPPTIEMKAWLEGTYEWLK